MSGVRFNVNGTGFKGGTVGSVEAGLVGVYLDGKPYKPNAAEVRELVPLHWRPAFDRAGPFWFDETGTRATVQLHDRRGRYLSTVYAHAVQP